MGLHGSWSFVANLVGKEARGETRRSHPRRGLREELSTPTLAGGRTGEREFFPTYSGLEPSVCLHVRRC